MKFSVIAKIVIATALLTSAGLAGMLSVEFAVSALVFAVVVRGSVYLIEKAITGARGAKELDRN